MAPGGGSTGLKFPVLWAVQGIRLSRIFRPPSWQTGGEVELTKERYLHFTLGPVQSFVGQARRTRDYWAGSFILAYLTGHAMAAVLEKGKIIYPSVMGGRRYR